MLDAAATPIQLRLAGAAVVLCADGTERPLDRHGALIAARLALGGPQSRVLLATWLWPDAHPARARANLRQRLLRLKALAGGEWIVGDTVLRLAPGVQMAPLDSAGGAELLEGIVSSEDEAEPLGAWLHDARATQRARQLRSLVAQANAAEAEQRLADAVAAVQQMMVIEPQAEAHRRHLMRLHYLGHDMARARSAFAELQRMLRQEFTAEPSAETQALFALVEQAARPPPSGGRDSARASAALQRPPCLVGRVDELAVMAQQLDARGAVLVLGEAGIGKSRLLAQALQGRSDVVCVKAQAGDAGVPYATLSRLLRAWFQHSGRQRPDALAFLLPDRRDAISALPSSAAPDAAPALSLHASVAAVLDGSALAGVVVDDLHFADEASVEMLHTLAADTGTSAAPPLAWLFAQRPGEGTPATKRLRDALVGARRLALLPLAPLDAPQLAELLRTLALPDVDPQALAPRLLRHTGGNPLFALEALKYLVAGRGLGESDFSLSLPLPQSLPVSALIDRRLQQLSEQALALARAAAVAGPDFNAEVAAFVLARTPLQLADAWAELEAAQVLRDSAFAHDLVQEAALRSVPQPVARHLHGAVANWLQDHDGEPARVAEHWLEAGLPQRAARWLADAADLAHRQLRPREEARFLEQLVECVEAVDPAQAVRSLLRLARAQTEAQGLAASAALLQRALHLGGESPERVLLLNLMAETQFNRLMPQTSAQTAAAALALSRALGDDVAAAEAVVRWHRALCMSGQAAQAEAVWAEHQPWMAAVVLPNAELVSDRGWVLDRLGHTQQARVWHQQALNRARLEGRPVDEAVVLANLAQSCLLSGEPAAALAAVDRAETLGTRHEGLHAASDYLAYYRGCAAAATGRFNQALGCFERALADTAAQSPQARLTVLAQRALLWAAIGQRGRAQADASEVLADTAQVAFVPAHAHYAMALATQGPGQSLSKGLQRALDALGDRAQAALDAPIRLKFLLAQAEADTDTAMAADALTYARGLLRKSREHRQAGLRWAAHWAAAQLALSAGRPVAARRHAGACLARPATEVAITCTEGAWWHGLWRVWSMLGESDRAIAARDAGLVWIERTQQQHLPAPFHISFREAVRAHRELLNPP